MHRKTDPTRKRPRDSRPAAGQRVRPQPLPAEQPDGPVNINGTGWCPALEDAWLAQPSRELHRQTRTQPDWRSVFPPAEREPDTDRQPARPDQRPAR